jgi:hypothetical protein
MDEIMANSWNDQAELKTFTLDNARIVGLPADNRQFFAEWTENPDIWGEGQTFYDWGVETGVFGTDDKDVIASRFVPFMIRKTSTAGTDPVVLCVMAGLSGICLLILIVLLHRKKKISGVIDSTGDPDIMRPKQ